MNGCQLLWAGVGIFVAGLFCGSNFGVLLMCILQVAGREAKCSERTLSYPVGLEGNGERD